MCTPPPLFHHGGGGGGGARLLTLTLRFCSTLTKVGLVVAAGLPHLDRTTRVKRLPCCLGRPRGYQGPHQRSTEPSLADQSGEGGPLRRVCVCVRAHCSPPGQMLQPRDPHHMPGLLFLPPPGGLESCLVLHSFLGYYEYYMMCTFHRSYVKSPRGHKQRATYTGSVH